MLIGNVGREPEIKYYEADDIIGTLDKMAENTAVPYDVTIVSGDKDLIQLADDNTIVEIGCELLQNVYLCISTYNSNRRLR